MTRESEVTTDPALVVGTPKAKTASLQRNSRILDRRTFRPSACLKNANKQTNLILQLTSANVMLLNGKSEVIVSFESLCENSPHNMRIMKQEEDAIFSSIIFSYIKPQNI